MKVVVEGPDLDPDHGGGPQGAGPPTPTRPAARDDKCQWCPWLKTIILVLLFFLFYIFYS